LYLFIPKRVHYTLNSIPTLPIWPEPDVMEHRSQVCKLIAAFGNCSHFIVADSNAS